MRDRCLSRLIVAIAAAAGAAAQPHQVPAPQADVAVPRGGAYAFSGPGKHFYPAYALHEGERVWVHGIEVGEGDNVYVQIIPAEDRRGFSWVKIADTVTRPDGTVVAARDRVPVFIGSDFDRGKRYVRQVLLRKGDEIIPRGEANDDLGAWYYIVPPQDEVRYVRKEELFNVAAKPVRAPANDDRVANADRGVGRAPAGLWAEDDPPRRRADDDGFFRAERDPLPEAPVAGNVRVRRPAQPAARTGTLAERLARLEQDVADAGNLEPSRRNLPELRDEHARLDRAARQANDAAAERRLATAAGRLARLEAADDAVRRTLDSQRRFQEEDERLAAEVERLRGATLPLQAASKPVAAGELQASTQRIDGKPVYQLADRNGAITHYVVAGRGLQLDKYLRRPVGLFGRVRGVRGVAKPVLDAEQVNPGLRLGAGS